MKKYKYLLLFIIVMVFTGCNMNDSVDLICTKAYDDGSEQIFLYSFKNDKVYNVRITFTMPESEMSNEEAYKTEFYKTNNIDGCNGEFTKNEDASYTTIVSCNLSKMSDSSVKDFFLIDREKLEISRRKVIDNYSSDIDVTCR